MKKLKIQVKGMSCAHCENRIVSALANANIKSSANAKKGIVEIQNTADIEVAKKIINELGFNAND